MPTIAVSGAAIAEISIVVHSEFHAEPVKCQPSALASIENAVA